MSETKKVSLSQIYHYLTFIFPGTFQLYDTDKSDSISKEEMQKVVTVTDVP